MARRYIDNFENEDPDDEFENPRTRVQTTSARSETTNTTVFSNTSVDGNARVIKYETTSRTVIQQQVARITESNTTYTTANLSEVHELFPELNISLDSPFSAASLRGLPPSFNTAHTTVTQNSGRHITSNVQEQRIKRNQSSSAADFGPNLHEASFDAPKTSTLRRAPKLSGIQRSRTDAQPFEKSGTNTPNAKLTSYVEFPKVPSTENFPTTPLGAFPKSSSTSTLQKQLSSFPKFSMTSLSSENRLKQGFAFIFNNENFDDEQNGSRIGTDADSDNLERTLNKLKLKVEVYKDASLSKIKSVVKTIANRDFKRHSCLVIAILTHGSRNERVQARDKSYSIDDDILFPIMKNASLSNKPKILFIQACKGYMEVEDFHKDKPIRNGTPSEILKCYSTFEGYVSYRTEQGTFFIQKLCEELQRNGETMSIQEIMRLVTAAVKQHTGGKQVPTMTVNLTQDFCFGNYM